MPDSTPAPSSPTILTFCVVAALLGGLGVVVDHWWPLAGAVGALAVAAWRATEGPP